MTCLSDAIPIFAPPRNPDVGYGESAELRRVSERFRAYRRFYATGEQMLVEANVRWSTLEQADFELIWSFLTQRLHGGATPFQWAPPDPVAAPGYAPEVEAITAGSLPSRSYAVSFTWYSTSGESTGGLAQTFSIAANKVARVKIPVLIPPGVDGWRVYFDGELQATITDGSLYWDEPTSGKASGAAPPTINTLNAPRLWVLGSEPKKSRPEPLNWAVDATFLEIPFFVTEPPVS